MTLGFEEKLPRQTLLVDSWSTPAWLNASLISVMQGKLQSRACYCTTGSQDTAQPQR